MRKKRKRVDKLELIKSTNKYFENRIKSAIEKDYQEAGEPVHVKVDYIDCVSHTGEKCRTLLSLAWLKAETCRLSKKLHHRKRARSLVTLLR